MLTVSTFLDRSAVNGIGLFAREPIDRGHVVWEFHPAVDLVYTAERWAGILAGVSPAARQSLRRYSYKAGNRFWLCTDNAQFMNHGGRLSNIGNQADADVMVALRDIRAGEELLCDYYEYSDPDDCHLARITRAGPRPSAVVPAPGNGGVTAASGD